MDTKPARTLVLGLTLAVGAVIGLAPASEARPTSPDPVLTTPTTPPHPDPDPDDCVGPICDAPGDLADPCSLHPDDCGPDVTEPGDPDDQGDPTDPGDPDDPTDPTDPTDPGVDPSGSGSSVNPDIVVRTPRFTG